MPKKNAKAQKSNELDGAEFFAAINLIEKEKGIPKAYMLEKITQTFPERSHLAPSAIKKSPKTCSPCTATTRA